MSARELVFADSNVMYSASLTSVNNFEGFWRIPGVDILTSQYSIEEVSRNLKTAEQRARLWQLIYLSHLVSDGAEIVLPATVVLPEKDQPILRSAIAGKATYLLTGDDRHFGPYFGQVIEGVQIEKPANYRLKYPAYFRETITR